MDNSLSYKMNKNQKMPRKLRKILVEKKRRERIDGCLKQIKELLFQGTEFQNDYMRMEKADILENVVKFIKCQNVHERSDRGSSEYRLGYIHCMREVTQVLEQICGKSTTPLIALQHYFNNKMNNLSYSDPRGGCVLKEENAHSHQYGSPLVSSMTRSCGGAFSPPMYPVVHPVDSCLYQQSPNTSYYSNDTCSAVPIKIEPRNNSETNKPLKRELDSSFETVQNVPDSTSQLSVQIPEQEHVNVENNDNNNNDNVVQGQGEHLVQVDDMWRPW